MSASPVLTSPGELLREMQGEVASALVERQFAAHPELTARYGPAGREKCLQDANYHLSFLADAMNVGNPALFVDYVGWAKVMLGKRGVAAEDLIQHLALTGAAIGDCLGGAAAALAQEYLDVAVATGMVAEAPLAALARGYLDALLRGERRRASVMILDAVAAGTPVKDIYLHVFQPGQHEVGRLWQVNQISVAQEHYCTAATQLVMSQLYPYLFAGDRTRGTMVAACVSGDLHEIGLRMVADFFELDGWNTFYLGASMPATAVVDTIVERGADVLAISATITAHLRAVADLVARVRAAPGCGSVKIIVGGRPFAAHLDLWKTMGADGCAADAQSAITLANQLVAHEAC